jgi:type I restriction enzyme S subunit
MSLTIPVSEIVERNNNPLLCKHASWGRILLGDIATIQNGCAFASSQFSKDGDMPLIRIRDVGKEETDTKYSGEYDEAYVVNPGDLLVGMDGDFNCARWRGPRGLLNQRVCRIKLTSDVYHPKLLDYVLPGYLKAINDNTSSVTVKHLSSKSIAEIPLPLPPMDQQELIVAEIEKQFSRLDEAVAGLKRGRANLKRYKASVLKAAVEGKLTEEWRKAHPNVESGAELLKRVLTKRKKKWEEKNSGKKYKEPVAPDTSNLPELTKGWVWASLDQLSADMMNGFGKRSQGIGQPRIVLRLADVVDGAISLADARKINCSDNETVKYSLSADDLLILRVNGSSALVGRFVSVHHNIVSKTLFCDHFIRLRAVEPLTASWLRIYADCERFRRFIDHNKVSSAGQNTISQGSLAPFAFPLPPLEELEQIRLMLSAAESEIHKISESLGVSMQRAERLRQAILRKAFSGELLIQ